jgi:hypothetical protein
MSDETNRGKPQAEAHLKNLEALVNARTEQLRQAVNQKHELLESIRQLQSLESSAQIKEGLQSTIEMFSDAPMQVTKLGGEPGEPVPEVDAQDIKTIWREQQELQARHLDEGGAIEMGLAEHLCTPGANIQAVDYRTTLIWMMTQIAPEQIASFLQDGQPADGVFRAAAKVPLEWMGVGIVRRDPPFDVNEFVRLCNES